MPRHGLDVQGARPDYFTCSRIAKSLGFQACAMRNSLPPCFFRPKAECFFLPTKRHAGFLLRV
ncbi:MAG: hypothetical protein NTX13_06105 [Acidobacteria bacterium]|nr:hypothetical protein [Acidobacteriota bacterium]